ncbi:uncharacterized protein [Watersipora subatra]|uniref:uncharacterized protein n=1 Tax=Watersipora subatra TaxID=2589382 RepID=UPI00355C43DE
MSKREVQSMKDLLGAPQLDGQRVVDGLDYCMVRVPVRGHQLNKIQTTNHQQAEAEYYEAINKLKASMYGYIPDQRSMEEKSGAENPADGIKPSFHDKLSYRKRSGYNLTFPARHTDASTSTRSELRRQLHVELHQLTTPSPEDSTLPKLKLSHGNPRKPNMGLLKPHYI